MKLVLILHFQIHLQEPRVIRIPGLSLESIHPFSSLFQREEEDETE